MFTEVSVPDLRNMFTTMKSFHTVLGGVAVGADRPGGAIALLPWPPAGSTGWFDGGQTSEIMWFETCT